MRNPYEGCFFNNSRVQLGKCGITALFVKAGACIGNQFVKLCIAKKSPVV